jgi:hypothetical protein
VTLRCVLEENNAMAASDGLHLLPVHRDAEERADHRSVGTAANSPRKRVQVRRHGCRIDIVKHDPDITPDRGGCHLEACEGRQGNQRPGSRLIADETQRHLQRVGTAATQDHFVGGILGTQQT